MLWPHQPHAIREQHDERQHTDCSSLAGHCGDSCQRCLHDVVYQVSHAGVQTTAARVECHWLLPVHVFNLQLVNSNWRAELVFTTSGTKGFGMITVLVHRTCWRPVTYLRTWASYSALYWLCSLSRVLSNVTPIWTRQVNVKVNVYLYSASLWTHL